MAIKREPISEDEYKPWWEWVDGTNYGAINLLDEVEQRTTYEALIPQGQHVNVVLLMLGAFIGGLGLGAVLAAVVAWIVMR